MQVHVLASGSTGNAVLLKFGPTRLLVDAGISARRIERGLAELGIRAADLDGILITHEHRDHINGLDVLVRRHQIPVYAREKTWEYIPCLHRLPLHCCNSFQGAFEIKGVWIEPFLPLTMRLIRSDLLFPMVRSAVSWLPTWGWLPPRWRMPCTMPRW